MSPVMNKKTPSLASGNSFNDHRWRPTTNSSSKAKVIGVAIADGRFEYWHVPSMKKLFTIKEP
jgi:hypothetical protein